MAEAIESEAREHSLDESQIRRSILSFTLKIPWQVGDRQAAPRRPVHISVILIDLIVAHVESPPELDDVVGQDGELFSRNKGQLFGP